MGSSNRREWLQTLLALLCPGLAAAARPGPRSIAYRADAVIVLFGLPIFSRAGVGGGFAEARQEADDDGVSRFLRFAGWSWPERAHGLDRAGYIEESVRLRQGSLVSARYFGVMTRSAEQTAEQARDALAAHGPVQNFAAIQGASVAEFRESASAAFDYPRGSGERNWRDLLEAARRRLGDVRRRFSGNPADAAGGPTPTFLYSLVCAMESHETRLKRMFVYGDRQLWLDTEKVEDARMSRELAGGAPVFKLTGAVRARDGSALAAFRIWFEASSAIPLRIDYQPRSFLRLSFVRDAEAGRGGSRSGGVDSFPEILRAP
jgi:hypothetical protein